MPLHQTPPAMPPPDIPFPTMNPTVLRNTCTTCQRSFTYEPVLCFGRDLAASLNKQCPQCRNQAERETLVEAAILRKQRNEDYLRATLPPDLRVTDTRHPDFNLPLWEVVRKWSATPRHRTLGIIGAAGLCKTRVLAMMAAKVILRGSRIVWTSAVRLKDAAHDRQSWDRETAALARQHLQECLTTPWLFLDDLGKNEWTPAFESQLFQILDHRLNHHLPMAWTANDHPEMFHPLLSPMNASPIIGRLLDRCTLLDLREG